MSPTRILAVARKEWRYRVRGNLWFLVLVQPLMFSLVWGMCASLDLRDIKLTTLDLSQSSDSRALMRQFEGSGAFQMTRPQTSLPGLEWALYSGEASMAVIVPPGFAADVRRGRPSLQVVSDGTDPNVSSLGVSYAVATAEAALSPEPPSGSSLRVWYNASLRSADLLLLGAVCYNLLWLLMYPAHSLMEERERGTMAVLGATPLSAVELWLGIQLAIGAVALWGTLTQLGMIILVADVPLRGNPALLLGGLLLFAFLHINLGCALPLIAHTHGQRTLYGLFGVFMTLSVAGFLIPQGYLPAWTQPIAEWLPLKHGLVFIRAVFLKGADAAATARELKILAAGAAATSVVALFGLKRLLRSEGAGA
jgi:ABC-2 type transport system permease protein